MIKFEIFADPICPWCFIGKTWFDRARETYPDQEFEVLWRPFQLNPEMPKLGMSRSVYLEKKFGSQKKAVTAYKPIIEASLEHNIKINFEKIKITPNTMDAHRLIHWGTIEGIQDKVVSRLFKAYFQEGEDIGNKQVLIEIGSASGLSSGVIDRLLRSNEDEDLIKAIDRKARETGITGVPMFIVDKTYAISGAQQTKLWKKVFLEIKHNQMERK